MTDTHSDMTQENAVGFETLLCGVVSQKMVLFKKIQAKSFSLCLCFLQVAELFRKNCFRIRLHCSRESAFL